MNKKIEDKKKFTLFFFVISKEFYNRASNCSKQ